MFDELKWMNVALQEARLAMNEGNVPIGAAIVKENELIAQARNGDFWHAEILCIQLAQKKLGKYLIGAKIFVTVQPCVMCMHALRLARIDAVIYGTSNYCEPLPQPEIIGGVLEVQTRELMQVFFKNLR